LADWDRNPDRKNSGSETCCTDCTGLCTFRDLNENAIVELQPNDSKLGNRCIQFIIKEPARVDLSGHFDGTITDAQQNMQQAFDII
jgi:hypothetical protein